MSPVNLCGETILKPYRLSVLNRATLPVVRFTSKPERRLWLRAAATVCQRAPDGEGLSTGPTGGDINGRPTVTVHPRQGISLV